MSRWTVVLIVAIAVCIAVFVANGVLGDVRSGNAWGLSYGAAALVLLLVATAYGARRRTMSWSTRVGAGSASAWLSVHTLAGALFLLLVLMHSGFGLPEGWITWGLWLLSLWTVASGFLGLALQRWIPRRLTSGLALEVHFDRIAELIDETRERAETIAGSCGETVRGFYERRIARDFRQPTWRWRYFLDISGGGHRRRREFEFLAERLSAEERDKLEELELLAVAKSEMDAHFTLQRALRLWLYLHLPTTLLLIALVAVHLFTVFYY